MNHEIIHLPKQKTWGALDGDEKGHFFTGYVGSKGWGRCEEMVPGRNVIITGDLKIVGMSRGRSAANFRGFFRGHENVGYELGMQGTFEIIEMLQTGQLTIDDGFISGRWTFAKQGCDVFLKPYGEPSA